MNISSGAASCLSLLQNAYENGIIPYPRVDNDFITSGSYDLFPHPSFKPAMEILKPLPFDSFTLNKQTSLLYLSTVRILHPAEIVDTAKIIDYYYDDDLEFISDAKREEALRIEEVLKMSLSAMQTKSKRLFSLYRDVFVSDASDTEGTAFCIFEVDEFVFTRKPSQFLAASPSILRSVVKWETSKDETAGSSSAQLEGQAPTIKPPGQRRKVRKFKNMEDGLKFYLILWAKIERLNKAAKVISDARGSIDDGGKELSDFISEIKK